VTTCPVCARREAAGRRGTGTPGRDRALLLRVWYDDGPRARLIGVDPPYRTVATAHGTDAICDAVRAWLSHDQRG
jgi:hypothetical protein